MDNLAEADAVAKDIKYLRDTTAAMQVNIENNLATNDELFSSQQLTKNYVSANFLSLPRSNDLFAACNKKLHEHSDTLK